VSLPRRGRSCGVFGSDNIFQPLTPNEPMAGADRQTPSLDYARDAFARMSWRRSKLSAGQTASRS
jgi:hypothetical protein